MLYYIKYISCTRFILKIFLTFLTLLSISLGFTACGYKAPPYYQEEVPASDKNVKFILQKKEFSHDTNTSCNSK